MNNSKRKLQHVWISCLDLFLLMKLRNIQPLNGFDNWNIYTYHEFHLVDADLLLQRKPIYTVT